MEVDLGKSNTLPLFSPLKQTKPHQAHIQVRSQKSWISTKNRRRGFGTIVYQVMPRFTPRFFLIAISVIILFTLFFRSRQDRQPITPGHRPDALPKIHHAGETTRKDDDRKLKAHLGHEKRKTAVVVASQASENATWLDTYFPQWDKFIYHVDDPSAKLTVPKNKGRESMVYLTCVLALLK